MNLGADIIADWQRQRETDDALTRVALLAQKAAAQLLPPKRVLQELQHPTGRWSTGVLLERLAALPTTTALRNHLRALATDLVARSDALRLAEQHHYNVLLRAVIGRLTRIQARQLVRPFINHRLKERRELAFSIFRWAGVDERTMNDLLERHKRTGEERLLKVVVAASGAGRMPDLLRLLPEFSDRYWQMRVLQATLTARRRIPPNVVQRYPTEFLQAMARARYRPGIVIARQLLRQLGMRGNRRVVAFYAWAMYELGEYDEVLRAWETLVRSQQIEGTSRQPLPAPAPWASQTEA